MASPYRFDAEPPTATGTGRSRTGLSAVTAGATSGGEGYRRSALLPGSRGFAAANFGAAPRTDYVAPVMPEPETPAATQTATVTAPPAPAAAQDNSWEAGRGGAGIEGGGPGANGMEPAGKPGDLGDLGIDIGGKTIGGMIGSALGGVLGGPVGAIAGGIAGRGIGSTFDGSGTNTGAGQLGNDPKGDMETNAMGGAGGQASGGTGAGPDPNANAGKEGLATGGRVGPQHLMKGKPMFGQKGGLGAVTAGKKPFMGKYAGGGNVMSPGYAQGGPVMDPGYQAGGPVNQVAGPNPSGPDDGYAALDQGEFVVKKDQAQRPDYGPILEQMNQGTYAPDGSQAHEGAESPGMEAGEGDDLDLDFGANGNYPPSTAESNTPDDMMQRLAMMPPEQSQALSQALSEPMVMSALFALLGPAFMGVMSALQGQGQQAPGMGGGGMQPPGMLGISPDRAGMRPPGGGLGSIQA